MPVPLFWLFLLTFSLVLHPWHKLQYFKNASWINNWINTMEQLICTQFEEIYAQNEVKEIMAELPTDKVHIQQMFFLSCWYGGRLCKHPKTYSTTYLLLHPLKAQHFKMNYGSISPQMLRMLWIPSIGGQKNRQSTLDFLGWCSITYQFPVCHVYILQ